MEQEEALKAELEKLRAEKEKFFSIVAFWLGSPLNTMKMLAEMTQASFAPDDKSPGAEVARHLSLQAEKTHYLMANLIQWASLEVGNLTAQIKPVNMANVVKKLIGKHEAAAEKKGVALSHSVGLTEKVMADDKLLTVVLDNLLSNAVKFSRKTDSCQLRISKTEDGTHALIEVADAGIGMGKAKLAKIFLPERQATQKGTANEEGFGLGLIVAKALLEQMGSTPEIVSQQGQGTTVSFRLPIAE